jgi:hypothetical protein
MWWVSSTSCNSEEAVDGIILTDVQKNEFLKKVKSSVSEIYIQFLQTDFGKYK